MFSSDAHGLDHLGTVLERIDLFELALIKLGRNTQLLLGAGILPLPVQHHAVVQADFGRGFQRFAFQAVGIGKKPDAFFKICDRFRFVSAVDIVCTRVQDHTGKLQFVPAGLGLT